MLKLKHKHRLRSVRANFSLDLRHLLFHPSSTYCEAFNVGKKARQLRCKTFSSTVVAKNWLKRVSDTLTDMELDNEFKLRVAPRLINKSVATWWDNLRLRFTALVT